jgi:Ca-activated chloride channel homolog
MGMLTEGLSTAICGVLPLLLMNPFNQFSSNARTVVLQATVVDRKGGFVSGLTADNFAVSDDGAAQVIRLVKQEDSAVSVGLIVDNSTSMRPKRPDVAAAALAFVHKSNPDDEMFVTNFNDTVTMGLPSTRLFSANPSDLESALSNASTGGKTALYDAVIVGLDHLEKASLNKKVLVVISDGGDNASKHSQKEMLDEAEQSGVVIYGIGLFDDLDTEKNPKVLNLLAKVSGGRAFFPKETSSAVSICEHIASEIRHQYTIVYVPEKQEMNGTFHTINVTAKSNSSGKLTVRTRSGYRASPEQEDSH